MSNFSVISPIDNSVYKTINFNSDKEVETKINKGHEAFIDWSNLKLDERINFVKKFVEEFLKLEQEANDAICNQIGRPISQCSGESVRGFKERTEHMIDIAKVSLQDQNVRKTDEFDSYLAKMPLGLIFIIAPWNYPILTAVNSIVPALIAGNSIILKHSSQTPDCGEVILKAIRNANIPEEVFQMVYVDHQLTEKIIRNSKIAHVIFTGSVKGGQQIKNYIGDRFIDVGLELGGKDPAYVRSDADISHAVENLVDGAYFNSGQSCCGIERIYVDQSVFEKFIDSFKSLTEKYVLDDPRNKDTSLGPVVKSSAARFINEQMNEAIEKGAKKLIDESIFKVDQLGDCYIAPQALINVDHSMRFMMEETFGPTVGIMSVENEKEALKLMNDSPYGLTASIWTKDNEFAKSFGRKIHTGTFFMNRCDYLDPALAWTGVKDTGRGCSLSSFAYDHLTRLQSFNIRTI